MRLDRGPSCRAGVIAALCALALGSGVIAGSALAAGQREWVVNGSLTGTYTNAVTWVNCIDTGVTGTASERVRLHASLAGRPAPYTPGSGFAPFGNWSGGGTWSVSGSDPPRQEQADGSVTCGPQRAFHCGGPLRRNGRAATMQFAPRGQELVGHFLQNASFTEGADPCPSIGSTLGGAGPLFGLARTDIERDAFFENALKPGLLRVPRARLEGRRPFTVRRTVGPDGGCARRSEYIHCTQAGRLTLTLNFHLAG